MHVRIVGRGAVILNGYALLPENEKRWSVEVAGVIGKGPRACGDSGVFGGSGISGIHLGVSKEGIKDAKIERKRWAGNALMRRGGGG